MHNQVMRRILTRVRALFSSTEQIKRQVEQIAPNLEQLRLRVDAIENSTSAHSETLSKYEPLLSSILEASRVDAEARRREADEFKDHIETMAEYRASSAHAQETLLKTVDHIERLIRGADKANRYRADSGEIGLIKIHFFFQMPQAWTTWETVWDACVSNPLVRPLLVLLPFAHDSVQGDTGARKFLADRALSFVDFSVYDLQEQRPDIVFLQNPYDSTRPAALDMWKVRNTGARIAYIPYGLDVGGGSDNLRWQYDLDVHRYAWRVFARSEAHRRMFSMHCTSGNSHVVVTGHPKIDAIIAATRGRESSITEQQGRKIILWTPHFSVEHGGWSTFDRVSESILGFFEAQPPGLSLIIRPHPLFFGRLRNITTSETEAAIRARFHQPPFIMLHEENEYTDLFIRSHALMADAGSFLLEYLPTGKPILYLHNPEGPGLSEAGNFTHAYYTAVSPDDVRDFLEMVAHDEDPMREERIAQISQVLHNCDGKAGITIVEHIVKEVLREWGLRPNQHARQE
ncbi:hypothetical protein BOSP111201_01360 [Bordetella sputigena]|uniref:CDP-glycerol glycerophosphotransferase family protein n=1 Tax=Bordetella sputigena TaxID=1416810 RepID=UPI0039EF4C97